MALRLRRFFYLSGAFVLLLAKFAIDVIAKNVALGGGLVVILRALLTAGIFGLLLVFVHSLFPERDTNPVKRLGVLLILLVAVIITSFALTSIPTDGFEAKDNALNPLDYPSLFVGSLLSLTYGVFALVIVRGLRDLVLLTRKRGSRRNFLLFVAFVLATIVASAFYLPLESSTITGILMGIAIAFAFINSFRLPWIVYLTKREKLINLAYSFLLFLGFIGLNLLTSQNHTVSRSLLFYSRPLAEFVSLSLIFAAIYSGMSFVSTLFHLPTAEAFDRKRSELSSLHTLGRLVTQVFDFEKLADTVTTMTLEVCEARSCWLEILRRSDDEEAPLGMLNADPRSAEVVGMKNITLDEIDAFHEAGVASLRASALEQRCAILIDDLSRDPRLPQQGRERALTGSLVVVPLVSHVGLLGVLYATKTTAYGFVQDDVDLISAFADQATIAIENSRLIEKSIERERLVREMSLARDMQKKLLPQSLPVRPGLDIDAVSKPAFEVGGDYYDFVDLPGNRIGIIVGDVSGKGVSAAFYMSEVKGIFQALSGLYHSPREFMIRANSVLESSIDKHSFVSLIYAILEVDTGMLTLSRAGHCPMLYISANRTSYVRPDGMGLGLGEETVFGGSIQEATIHLQPGDVCVFYTDGITEAHHHGEEFGYERLSVTAEAARLQSAAEIKEEILAAVSTHADHQPNHDDLTLVVLKWIDNNYHPHH